MKNIEHAKAGGESDMKAISLIIIVWSLAAIGTIGMKKVAEESWVIYSVYAAIMGVLFTIFAITYFG